MYLMPNDTTRFEISDMVGVAPYIGLCFLCTLNLNAQFPTLVGTFNKGFAKDLEGSTVIFPSGNTMKWEPHAPIPPSYDWLPEIAMTFGPNATFLDNNGAPLPVFATTIVDGSMVCNAHVEAAWNRKLQSPQRTLYGR